MAKFISRLKDLSAKFSSSGSAESESAANSSPVTHADEESGPSRRSPAKRLLRRSQHSDNGASAPNPYLAKLSVILRPLVSGPKPIYRNRLFWLSLLIGGGACGVAWGWASLERGLPQTDSIFTYVRDGTLTIRASDNTILQQLGPATREKLTINEIPKPLVQAFIASEDRRFYKHDGVDYQGIVRATASNLLAGDVVQGGSTITQQVARIVFLNQERSIVRKIKEAMLAQKLEEQMTKDQILERYLNLVYLGSGAYGVADAAWVYFSKPINKLTLPEAAMIAGLPPAPSVYSPLVNQKAALQRRNLVLQRMQDVGFISAADAQAAIAAPLNLKPSYPKRLSIEAPYFTSYIQQQLPKYVSPEDLEIGGLTVETTLNVKWQRQAEQVVKDAVELDGAAEGFSQAAIVALDPRTGEVKVMVGGYGFDKSQFNRATQAQRQPGSTFKTFVYTAGIAAGFSPNDGYLDAPYTVDGYQPQNYGKTYRGWMSMREALAQSVNVIALKVLLDVGFDPTIKMAQQMGIKSKLNPTYSLALGASEVNLFELTNAYGALAAKGKAVEAHGIRRILNRQGKVLYTSNFKSKQVVDKETASIMTWMLESVVISGSGRAAQLGRPVAGKTGTSEEARDLWFIGYIPQLVTGVWLGNDNNDPTWGTSGTAAFTWRQFMSKVVQGMPVEKFPDLPALDGRKGTIKAKPITPKRAYTGPAPAEPSYDSGSSSGGGSSDYYESEPAYSEPAYSEPANDPAPPVEEAPPEPTYEEAPPPVEEAPVEEAPVEEAGEPAPPEPEPPAEAEPAPPE